MASTLVWGTVSVSTDLVWGLGSFLGDWGLEEFIGSFLGEEGRDDSLRGDVGLILPAKHDYIFNSSVHQLTLTEMSSFSVRIHVFVLLHQTSSKQTDHKHVLSTQTYRPVPGSQVLRMTRKGGFLLSSNFYARKYNRYNVWMFTHKFKSWTSLNFHVLYVAFHTLPPFHLRAFERKNNAIVEINPTPWKGREIWARDLNFAYPTTSEPGTGHKPTDRLGLNEKYLNWKA